MYTHKNDRGMFAHDPMSVKLVTDALSGILIIRILIKTTTTCACVFLYDINNL